MKSPDEIKKGLADNIPVHCHPGDLEPRLTPLMMVDLEDLHADALALVQQLQDDNAQLNRCIENMTDKLNAMNDEVAKLQAERDAAVEDLKYVAACKTCKEFRRSALTEPCLHCTKYGLLDSENKYEWRGVQKEE